MQKARLIPQFALGLRGLLFAIFMCLIMTGTAVGADRLIVENGSGTTTFKVEDSGAITSSSSLFANGASAWGEAPFVLGQNVGHRGIVITDKASSNQKNIYFGWNAGSSHDYAEIFALQEGVAWKNLVFAPSGGNVGIGTTRPSYPLQMGSGAYVSPGGVWTDASSREYKEDIKDLSTDEAMDALKGLNPVKFSYRASSDEQHVGFIAEDVPKLVATKNRKGNATLYVEPTASCGGNTPCYASIQEAMDAAGSEAVIKIAEGAYPEDIHLSSAKTLTLQGGWNSAFTTQVSRTTINSSTISSGTVKAEHLVCR